MSSDGSVTKWIDQLQAGQEGTVQQELWNRYFQRLIAVAREKLRSSPRGAEDEEDAVLSALDSFFQRVQIGQFPLLRDRTSLWPLLVKITVRKALNQRRRALAKKRRAVAGCAPADNSGDEDEAKWIEQIAGHEPSPEIVAEATEAATRLMAGLETDSLRQVAQLKLEGYTNREIAERQGVIERTIERRLVHIRNLWSEDAEMRS